MNGRAKAGHDGVYARMSGMNRRLFALATAVLPLCGLASAQTAPPLRESAKAMLGIWEFSNAERNKICTADFKSDPTAVGYKVTFDANCAALFPLVANIVGWKYQDNDLLYLLNAQGEALIEFSEVEDGQFEAPTPGLGVLFLQNPAAANPPARLPEQIAGNWALKRGDSAPVCSFALAMTPTKQGLALSVRSGCDSAIAKLVFTQWRLEKGNLVLVPAKGPPWRFVEIDDRSWARVPESAEQIRLLRQ